MTEEKYFTSFTCQRCLQPLRLDDSLNSFGEHILAELTCKNIFLLIYLDYKQVNYLISVPVISHTDMDLESQTNSFDHYVHPYRLSDSGNGANGFMVISDGGDVETFSNKLKVSLLLNLSYHI